MDREHPRRHTKIAGHSARPRTRRLLQLVLRHLGGYFGQSGWEPVKDGDEKQNGPGT